MWKCTLKHVCKVCIQDIISVWIPQIYSQEKKHFTNRYVRLSIMTEFFFQVCGFANAIFLHNVLSRYIRLSIEIKLSSFFLYRIYNSNTDCNVVFFLGENIRKKKEQNKISPSILNTSTTDFEHKQ